MIGAGSVGGEIKLSLTDIVGDRLLVLLGERGGGREGNGFLTDTQTALVKEKDGNADFFLTVGFGLNG